MQGMIKTWNLYDMNLSYGLYTGNGCYVLVFGNPNVITDNEEGKKAEQDRFDEHRLEGLHLIGNKGQDRVG